MFPFEDSRLGPGVGVGRNLGLEIVARVGRCLGKILGGGGGEIGYRVENWASGRGMLIIEDWHCGEYARGRGCCDWDWDWGLISKET